MAALQVELYLVPTRQGHWCTINPLVKRQGACQYVANLRRRRLSLTNLIRVWVCPEMGDDPQITTIRMGMDIYIYIVYKYTYLPYILIYPYGLWIQTLPEEVRLTPWIISQILPQEGIYTYIYIYIYTLLYRICICLCMYIYIWSTVYPLVNQHSYWKWPYKVCWFTH